MGCRLLPRLDSYGLREHVEGDGLLSGAELTITSKAVRVLQGLSRRRTAATNMDIVCALFCSTSA